MGFEPGHAVGDYEILRLLGRGGMGRVYLVRNVISNRIEAMKVLVADVAAAGELADRFMGEIRILAQLDHPNIARFYNAFKVENQLVMVMEFLEGSTLSELSEHAPMPLGDVLNYVAQTLGALDYAHKRGVIHRDVKPGNVMITPEGVAKLMDFGIAKSNARSVDTMPGITVGSLLYMSPEQVVGKAVDARSDIYSVGVVLYELTTGHRPFDAETNFAILEAHVRGTPKPPGEVNPALPKALTEIILMAMEKDPKARFQSADAFRSALESLRSDKQVASATQSFWATIGRLWNRKNAAASAPPQIQQGTPVTKSTSEQTAITKVPAAPMPAAAPAPIIDEGQYTQLFGTAPEAPPPVASGVSVPAVPGPTATGEFTRLFTAEDLKPPPRTSSGESLLPDVGVTISECADANFVGRKMAITRVPFRIGRDSERSHFVLSFDSAVSGAHAEIDFQNNGFLIRDLGSSNGTFLNGKQLQADRQEPLLFGARVLIGSNTQLIFVSNELDEIPELKGQTIVGGRFLLQERLYSSAKSVVYSAKDQHLGLEVAVKILSPRLASYPGYRAQFRREAETASRILHHHICPVLDFGETELVAGTSGTSLYVVMKHLEGGNLAQKLASGHPLAPADVAIWMEKICGALDYIHKRNIVHGGIKPSAIVFSENEPYLSDFALASSTGDQEHHSVIGSPAYLAPEQWAGEDPSPATDLYAIGVVTYLCLTGSLPFEKQESPKIRESNLTHGPVEAHEMARRNGRTGVSEQLSPVLTHALAKLPSQRFASGAEFATALLMALKKPSAPIQKAEPVKRPLIFISHHRPASAFLAILIQRELETLNYDVFVDSQQKDTVGRFPEKIELNIKRSDVFVCLLAPSTLDSPWVNREIELALAERKAMLPVFQEGFTYSSALTEFPEHVRELLQFDGVKFSDAQRHMVKASLAWLAESIEILVREAAFEKARPRATRKPKLKPKRPAKDEEL